MSRLVVSTEVSYLLDSSLVNSTSLFDARLYQDGFVYIWDAATGEILQRLGSYSLDSHTDIAYRAVWNARQSLLVR